MTTRAPFRGRPSVSFAAGLARAIVLGAALVAGAGCSLFPGWLRPENRWRLNSQEPGAGEHMYFSVPAAPLKAKASLGSLDEA